MNPIKKKYLIAIIAICFSTGAVAQTHLLSPAVDSTYQILTYGLPDSDKFIARNTISEKWGIGFYAVAGCIVSKQLEDSADRINEITYKKIVAKYGSDWREKFDKEVDSEYGRQKKILKFLQKDSFIISKNVEIEKEEMLLQYAFHLTPVNNIYKVDIYGTGYPIKEDGNYTDKLFAVLQLDWINKKMYIVSNTAINSK